MPPPQTHTTRAPNASSATHEQAPPEVAAARASVETWLGDLRRQARALLVGQAAAWIIGCAVCALLVGGTLDYLLRAPMWLRTLGTAGAWATLAWAIGKWVLPALRFAPSLTEVALRAEKSAAGARAGLGNTLASAVELGSALDTPRELVRPVLQKAQDAASHVRVMDILSPSRAVRAVVWAAGWTAVLAMIISIAPTLAVTGASRMLWPWGGAEWPKRTAIVDVTGQRVHPLGSALALRAALTRSDRPASDTRVTASYRVIADGRTGSWRTLVLTDQSRLVQVPEPVDTDERQGALFERLIEPSGLSPESARAVSVSEAMLEYTIESGDDRTDLRRVRLIQPPTVVSAQAVITSPAYARTLGIAPERLTLDLGPGTDERAAPAPVLAGSEVSLSLTLSKGVPGDVAKDSSERIAWISRSLGTDLARMVDAGPQGAAPGVNIVTSGPTWVVSWRLAESVRLVVRPADEFGIVSGEDAAYRIDALKDNPPTVNVITPQEDRTVLATASVELRGEARDDVGLVGVSLERQVARKPKGSEGAAPEATEPGEAIARTAAADAPERTGASKLLRVETTLDLSTLNLSAGDEVWITAIGVDAYELDGVGHAPVRSGVRKLRIISRDELIEQVWGELSGVRRAAIRLDQEQVEAQQQQQRPGDEQARRASRTQAGISERLSRQAEQLARIDERVKENALADQSLAQVMQQAKEAVRRAGEESVSAGQQLAEAAQQEAQEGAPPEAGREQREKAGTSQDRVREQLAKLVDMLDRGEDTFASKRAIERLLQQQRSLQQRTGQAAEKTAGKDATSLTPQEREELAKIAQEQKDAAEQLADAVQKMNQREQSLRKRDPAAAQAMAKAAQRAERDRASEKMQRASQQVQQNQVGAAQQQQADASRTMEQMLKDIDQTAKNRNEVLRRQLASLIESLEGLIRTQEANLKRLDENADNADLSALGAAMMQLHQNTLGVLDQAMQGGRELEAVSKFIEKAAAAQGESVTHLRAKPARSRDARSQEQTSLDRLNEALAAAKKADEEAEDRQSERSRANLREKYQAMLDKQISLKDGAAALAEGEKSRRSRAAARQLGEEQLALRGEASAMRDEVSDIKDAKVFDYAHRRLDALMSEAGDALSAGDATDVVVARQTSAARVLKSLVEALAERKKKDKPFREGQQGGGGGGGGGGKQPLLPPAREVALLRDLQIEAAELTRAGSTSATKREELVKLAGQLQRELAEQAAELLKRLSEKQDEPDGGIKPAPLQPKEEPKPESLPEEQDKGGAG